MSAPSAQLSEANTFGAAGGAAPDITFRGLLTARWVMIGITAGLGLVFGGWVSAFDAPSLQLFGGRIAVLEWYGILAGWVVASAVGPLILARLLESPATAAGIQLALDGLAFTALFAVSRGAANPFTTLYFIPIMLATQVSPRWTWLVAAVCLSGFGSLFAVGPAGPHGPDFAAHLRGMWLAFAVSGVVITFFVHRIAIAIARQQAELYALREGALRDRQLAQIGSLAAGAAHELGTPLATLNVLVGELGSMSDVERAEAVDSMRDQLGRCKRIIGSMANAELRADAMAAIEIEPWAITELAEELEDRDVAIEIGEISGTTTIPRTAILEILDELIGNAREACVERVAVSVDCAGDQLVIAVSDDGHGMTPEIAEAARDPFFTTRGGGEHMGLGLFLAEAKLRQLSGSIELESAPGEGTTVTLRLPMTSPEGAGSSLSGRRSRTAIT
jgi:two-component system sensor histidine kinase RegB